MKSRKINSKYLIRLLTIYLFLIIAVFVVYRVNLERKTNQTVNNNFGKVNSYLNQELTHLKTLIQEDKSTLDFDNNLSLIENEFYFDLKDQSLTVFYFNSNNNKRYYFDFNYFSQYYDELAKNYLVIKKDGEIVYSKEEVLENNIIFYLINSKKVDKALDLNNVTIKHLNTYASFKSLSTEYYFVEVINADLFIRNLIPSILIYLAYVILITIIVLLLIKYYYIDQEKIENKVNQTLISNLEYINMFQVNKKGKIINSNNSFKQIFKVRPNMISDLSTLDNWQKVKTLKVIEDEKEYLFNHYLSNNVHTFINTNYLEVINEQENTLYYYEQTQLPNLKSFNRDLEKGRIDNFIYSISLNIYKNINVSESSKEVTEIIKLLVKNIGETMTTKHSIYQTGLDVLVLTTNVQNDNLVREIVNKTKQETYTNTSLNIHFTNIVVDLSLLKDLSSNNINKKIDITLKHAKELESASIINYDKNIEDHYAELETIEKDLHQALLNDEFVLYYQPQLNLKKNKVESFEALIRWNHPRYRKMSPDKFLKVAEETNLIYEITTITINKIIEFIRSLNNSKDIKVAFNASPKQLMEQGFINKLINAIQEADVNPNQVAIEIIENVFIDSFRDVNEKIKALQNYGIEVHIDDFGSGYSSFRYLSDLDVDVLKIDRRFIVDMKTDNRIKNIVKTIIDLGHYLDLEVIAEGVETKDELSELKKLKCDYIQGYLVSMPLKESDAIDFLKNKLDF